MTRVEKKMEKMSKPELDFPLHQSHLRKTLLNRFERRPNLLLNMLFKKILPTGIAMALVLVMGSLFISKSPEAITPVSAAEQAIDSTIQKVQNLTEAELEVIMQKTGRSDGDSVISLLENAKNSADLVIVEPKEMSCEEAKKINQEFASVENIDPITNSVAFKADENGNLAQVDSVVLGDLENCNVAQSWQFSSANGSQKLNLIYGNDKQLTYLQYTRNGNLVVLGLDEEGLPLTALDFAPDASEQVVDMGEGGSTTIKMVNE